MKRIKTQKLAPGLFATIAFALVALAPVAWSHSGIIVDEAGEPLADVEVCYMAKGVALRCIKTNAEGYWSLAEGPYKQIRAWKEDHLALELELKENPEPVTLMRAATLWLEIKSKDGKEVTDARVFIIQEGEQPKGPLPVNRSGLRLRGIKPGAIQLQIEVPGYRALDPGAIELKRGQETRQVVWVEPLTGMG